MKLIKCLASALVLFTIMSCSPSEDPTVPSDESIPSIPEGTSEETPVEGKLHIRNYTQYLTYNSIKIEKYMDKVLTPDLDLYYYIVDEDVATIENDYIIAHKVGETSVFASTITGQEVEFTISVRPDEEFIYNREVNSFVEAFKTKAGNPKDPTIFVGDSFFDVFNFWTSFYDDFEGYPVASMGISGSQSTHQMICRDKLLKQFNPKNIVIHIGTNDVNDASSKTVDQYYTIITTYLDTLCVEYPDVNIYYLGIENRVAGAGGKNAYAERVTEKIKTEFSTQYDNFHYIDSPAVFNADQAKYMSADCVHPSRDGYLWYIDYLKNVIEF